MLQEIGELPKEEGWPWREVIDAKKAKVEKFLAYSKECGCLTDEAKP